MRVKPHIKGGLDASAVSGIMRRMKRSLIVALFVLFVVGSAVPLPAFAQAPRAATPADQVKVPPGFKVELLRSATEAEGTWVCMAVDDKGRLYISAQYDKAPPQPPFEGLHPLLRVTLKD